MEDSVFTLPHARKPDEAIYPLEPQGYPDDLEAYFGCKAFGDDYDDLTPAQLAELAGEELPF